jgi:hypothetical protein
MTLIKSHHKTRFLIAFTTMGLLPIITFAASDHLLENLVAGEPWDRGLLVNTKTVLFNQNPVGGSGTDATQIAKITLSYFTTANCSGPGSGTNSGSSPNPSYTTPDSSDPFPISPGTPFGLVASSAWKIGNTKLSIADMTMIASIAVTFKSTTNNTPQANFSTNSFACIPVSCNAGECTSVLGTQNFTLKTTATIGDPADGGYIACLNNSDPNLNLVVAKNNYNTTVTSLGWTPSGSPTSTLATGATSTGDGASNTGIIVTCFTTGPGGNPGCPHNIGLTTYAAGTCPSYSANGGYTIGWFLPAIDQLNCIYNNKALIGGFGNFPGGIYWSSTENNATTAKDIQFATGVTNNTLKRTDGLIRCARSLVS